MNLKITQEMLDDWSSPEGYSDFRFDTHYKNEFYNYQDGIAIVRGDQYAIEAREGDRGKLKLIPIWVHGREDGIINMLEGVQIMPEPEFSLDEMEVAEELLRG